MMVNKWNRSQSRPKYEEQDAIEIDGEIRILDPNAVLERKTKMPNVTVSMSRYGIVDLALHGQEERVEGLFHRLNLAMRRLKIPFTGARGFRKPSGEARKHPGLFDVQRWLDSIKRVKKNKDEMAFIASLYSTCRSRVRPEVLKKMESKDYKETSSALR